MCKGLIHEQDRGIWFIYRSAQKGVHKAIMMTIKIYHYLYILASKGINIYWIQVTQFLLINMLSSIG